MMLGLREIRNIAITVELMNTLAQLRKGVVWRAYWSHSLLAARLTDKLVGTFRTPSGMEYLAGLLHNVGKLIIARCFPRQHDEILSGVQAGKGPEHEIEMRTLGIDHARIGAALAVRLKLHPSITLAIRFHNDPMHPDNVHESSGERGFMAACVAVAEVIANEAQAGGASGAMIEPEELPEWAWLESFERKWDLRLDLKTELLNVDRDLKNF